MSTRILDYYFENNLSSSSSAVSFRICSLICSRAAFYSSLVFGLCVLGSALLPPTAIVQAADEEKGPASGLRRLPFDSPSNPTDLKELRLVGRTATCESEPRPDTTQIRH